MAEFSGKFQYLNAVGAPLCEGSCELSFDAETCTVTPDSAAPLVFDLGDIDRLKPGEWELELALYTGDRVQLRQFGKASGRMSQELIAAWRDRTVRCLLLEDLEEVARYDAAVTVGRNAAIASEARIYKSNIAILPAIGTPLQWRLADVDSISFDDGSYAVILQSGAERLAIGKLGKKTDECLGKLRQTHTALRSHAAKMLHTTFPFLSPDPLQKLAAAMPEGRSVRLSGLSAIHPKLVDALIAKAVDERLRPYFEALRARSQGDSLMVGFKFIRAEEDSGDLVTQDGADEEESAEPDDEQEKKSLFFWFFSQVSASLYAWEASTGSGRATYFFRAPPGAAEEAVRSLTRGLALVNFRREPIYLPDETLEREQRYHRYAIGIRKLPDLRTLRASFAGRAAHSSVEAWTNQMKGIVGP